MPHVVWNLGYIEVSEKEIQILEDKELVYDPYHDCHDGIEPGTIYYPTDDNNHDNPMDLIEATLNSLRKDNPND